MSIKIPILLTLFATLITNSETPRDLCDLVYTDTGKPILCQPHPDNAPRYDAAVCCSERGCVPARGTSCLAANLFYCELGKVQATGEVSCYFEVPGYCDVFPCEMGFQPPPAEAAICCNQGICWPTTSGANDCELLDIVWCDSVVSNADGTVTCLDDN